MATPEELETLTRSFSGFGVDEKTIITVLAKWKHEQRKSFRKRSCPTFFNEDERLFEKWNAEHFAFLEREFSRFKNAVVMWTKHPWERDACLLNEALKEGTRSYYVLYEIACTRSAEELLGARKAYHSLFDCSIEEDVVSHVQNTDHRNFFVAMLSAYRYEGSKVNDEIAKKEAKFLCDAIKKDKNKNPVEDDQVLMILSTRSKSHLKSILKHYEEMFSKTVGEDLDPRLCINVSLKCLCSPQVYFSKILNDSLESGADERKKAALTRVIVTQADSNMKEITEQFQKDHGVPLSQKIKETTHGNYQDFLLTLIERQE